MMRIATALILSVALVAGGCGGGGDNNSQDPATKNYVTQLGVAGGQLVTASTGFKQQNNGKDQPTEKSTTALLSGLDQTVKTLESADPPAKARKANDIAIEGAKRLRDDIAKLVREHASVDDIESELANGEGVKEIRKTRDVLHDAGIDIGGGQ